MNVVIAEDALLPEELRSRECIRFPLFEVFSSTSCLSILCLSSKNKSVHISIGHLILTLIVFSFGAFYTILK